MRKIKAVALLTLLALSLYAAPKVMSQGNFAGPANASAGAVVHLQGTSGQPSVSLGTGAGTGASASLSGTDLAGTLSVTCAGSPAASNATVATLTFSTAYSSAPNVVLSPANAAAAALSGATSPFATASTTALTLKGGSSALSTTTYKWSYLVSQ